MQRVEKMMLVLLCMVLIAGVCSAQTQQAEPAEPSANVISGTVAAIGYPVGGGGTKVTMVATQAASQASGEARVEAKKSGTEVSLKVAGMPQPTVLGAEFLTYVLWTVTPDGTTTNLGEIPIDKTGQGKLDVTAQSQTFALIVTAEPYYAVHIPSELVVLVNETRKNTKGKIYPDNSYKLMRRSEYTKQGNPLALTPDLKKIPLDIYEARNAVEIAKSRGAEQYAPEVFSKATSSLQMAENALAQNSSKNQLISAARQTIQFAEDARSLAVRRETAQRIQQEKEAAAAAAAAKAKAAADAQAAEEARRQAELTAAKEAQMKAEAAAQAAQAASQAAAQQAALQAKAQAARDEAARAQAATEALRAELLRQLNDVLQTTDSPRGLVVNMADVLFETGKYALSSDAQLKLAKLSGIIQAHPGLNLAIEGYTDTTGTAEFNLTLSQQRADTVRTFLIAQGLSPDTITAKGLGESNPIADNSTAAGRKLNRRVEIIVSGSIIGVQISK
ncbi:MAG TPA: OmpA family protein [Candidatus Acidoferrales bacterium]|nr:OmpA family protein [Candidatus Acidoferrales bacterium]